MLETRFLLAVGSRQKYLNQISLFSSSRFSWRQVDVQAGCPGNSPLFTVRRFSSLLCQVTSCFFTLKQSDQKWAWEFELYVLFRFPFFFVLGDLGNASRFFLNIFIFWKIANKLIVYRYWPIRRFYFYDTKLVPGPSDAGQSHKSWPVGRNLSFVSQFTISRTNS